MLYTTFENKQIIRGILIAVDPIHIGAASKDTLNPIELDNAVLKDSQGNPLIPGSSVKGVVRSQFEAVLRSIGRRVCDIHNDKDDTCASKRKIDDIKSQSLSGKQQAQSMYDISCDVCRLFGGRQFAGKLHFKDCYYVGDAPCKFEKRDGVGIDRVTGAAKGAIKYDFEIIPKGTRFDFELIAENLDEEQTRYLDFILEILCGNGITDEDYIAVGGKTSRGLGRVRLEITSHQKIDADAVRSRISRFLNPDQESGKGSAS